MKHKCMPCCDQQKAKQDAIVAAASRLLVGLSGVSTPDCEWYEGIAADAEDELRIAIAKVIHA